MFNAKDILVLSVMAAVIVSSFKSDATAQSVDDTCSLAEYIAESSMTSRQNGGVLSQSLSRLDDDDVSGPLRDLSRAIFTRAYEVPRFRSEAAKENAVIDFKNEIFLECITEGDRIIQERNSDND